MISWIDLLLPDDASREVCFCHMLFVQRMDEERGFFCHELLYITSLTPNFFYSEMAFGIFLNNLAICCFFIIVK